MLQLCGDDAFGFETDVDPASATAGTRRRGSALELLWWIACIYKVGEVPYAGQGMEGHSGLSLHMKTEEVFTYPPSSVRVDGGLFGQRNTNRYLVAL